MREREGERGEREGGRERERGGGGIHNPVAELPGWSQQLLFRKEAKLGVEEVCCVKMGRRFGQTTLGAA